MEHKDRLGCGVQVRKIKKLFRFPSLFSRLVTVYISILVGMLVILFMTMSNAYKSYFVEYTQDLMLKQAMKIADEYYKAGTYTTSKKEVLDEIVYPIQIMNGYLEATTWVVDQDGGGIVVYDNECRVLSNQEVFYNKDVQKVFDGMVVSFENGFKEYFSTPMLTIGYPIEIGGKVQCALFIHTSMPYVLQTIDEVRGIILNVVGLVGSIMIIWIYFTSKQITRPLKEMNDVAKTIANGQFDKRIQVEGEDEIAELALSFNDMASELDKIDESRNSFIANVSHDLRSPLTSIQGFVTAILDGTISPEKQERYLKIVLSESQRMISMTNTILELNKLQEASTELEKNKFNISTMIEQSCCSVEKRALEKNVKIECSLDRNHLHVLGDIDGIHRVLQNLIDNSLKFVNYGGTIRIATIYREGKIWVAVTNSGPSIPKEQHKEIWTRFYKGDRSRGLDKKGVGLGLVIVKEIIKRHGEQIGVRSEEGEPVIFYFSLTATD